MELSFYFRTKRIIKDFFFEKSKKPGKRGALVNLMYDISKITSISGKKLSSIELQNLKHDCLESIKSYMFDSDIVSRGSEKEFDLYYRAIFILNEIKRAYNQDFYASAEDLASVLGFGKGAFYPNLNGKFGFSF